MADDTTDYNLTNAWTTTNRYTATGDVDILIGNMSETADIFFRKTTSEVSAPSSEFGARIPPGDTHGMQLTLNEQIWLRSDEPDGEGATVPAVIME